MLNSTEYKARVGYIVKRYPRYSETFIVNEILAHEAAGIDIEIFSLRPPEDTHFQDAISRVRAPVNYLPHAGIKAVDFWSALDGAGPVFPGFWSRLETAGGENHRDVYHAAVLARMLRLKGINHVHAHFATSSASVARLAARFCSIPYTFTAHAKDIFHNGVQPGDLRRKLNDASAVITVSDYNLKYLKEHYGSSASRVSRIYNGLDLDRFPYREPEERAPRILAIGRLIEKKGFADLVEACRILAGRKVPFHCQIIGTGPLEQELRAMIDDAGIGQRVELLGPRPQEEVISYMHTAAVFAAPCVVGSDGNRDGLPTVLLEAMALGAPVVSTDVTGIPEIIRNNVTGLMAPQHSPAALADAIDRLLKDVDLRVRLALSARKLVETEFDIHRNASLMREFFFPPSSACEKDHKVAGEVR